MGGSVYHHPNQGGEELEVQGHVIRKDTKENIKEIEEWIWHSTDRTNHPMDATDSKFKAEFSLCQSHQKSFYNIQPKL